MLNNILDNIFNKKKPDDVQLDIVNEMKRKSDSQRILNEETSFDVKESFKELRTNILFSLPGKGTKKLLVTSSIASEGKSTTSINMAITFAENNVKVLLIDCDLRCPNIGRLLEDKEKKGLSNILVNDCGVEEALHSTKYKNLDVILAGAVPPNPTELLSSEGMKSFVEFISEYYDYIIFDAPPVNVVTDAAIISELVSGVVIVSRQYVTDKNVLADAIEKLKFVNAKILGIVLNDVVMSKSGYSRYGRYDSYSKLNYYNNSKTSDTEQG